MKKLHKFVFIYKEIKCAEFPAKVEPIIDNSHLKSNSPPQESYKDKNNVEMPPIHLNGSGGGLSYRGFSNLFASGNIYFSSLEFHLT